ncbi:fumarylacetoacetate hydrolase family protein [Maritimibacter sp. DP1N21-5]|uniref:fumarylacetoacetate hydrolase family protein n=1 Tax=Maritimibacter sp. DP1N21-5 TaxID=2836867 RepID=UPI001C459655|nr:fumarylacetoacetate hydrolase family protein [Maritimibacter sp. DP1N21-5]MBV7407832.1 fumarylacetoacetate hydrolase family protein [Maritimibacter sp. DP1N21-5]
MKIFRFGERGLEQPGVVDKDGGLRDLSGTVPDFSGETLSPAHLAQIAAMDLGTLPLVPDGARIGAPVGGTRNFIGVGLNFADHAAEAGMDIPSEPILFNKAPSCIVGPNDDVVLPRGSVKSDWEVELAIVIGTGGSYIDEEDALTHVAGFTICNDLSEREYQIERMGTWSKGKGCPTFGPLGPWLVTPDEVDTADLAMELDLNGRPQQRGSTSTMIFKPAFLVSYISRFMALEPGDVICTGTPPGVGMGMKPPLYLKAGDEMRLSIAGLGAQRQKVVSA